MSHHYPKLACASVLIGLLVTGAVTHSWSQSPAPGGANPQPPTAAGRTGQSPIVGKWTYRSFISNPDLSAEPNSLLFGQGTMERSVPAASRLSGTLGGDGWSLVLAGTVTERDPPTIRFEGKGNVGGEEWVYDYLGYLVPSWPNGIDQRPAIVGSIVRKVAHSRGSAPAGYVAQWIAVKQDPANAPRGAAGAPSAPTTPQQLRDLERDWASAAAANDVAKIGRFLSDDFLFVGAGGVLQSRQQHLDDFASHRLKLEAVVVDDAVVHVYGDFAVVNTRATVKGKLGDRDISGPYRFMDTWKLAAGQWVAVARQQTRAPNPPPSGEARFLEGAKTSSYQRVLREMYLDEERKAETANRAAGRSSALRAIPRAAPQRRSSSLQPPTVRSANGRLEVTLEVDYDTFPIGKDDVRLRTYNHRPVGPVLRAKAGDTLFITLVNRLPTEPADTHSLNGHHAWNTTNLHFHGLHVAPQGTPDAESDNVLLELEPNANPKLATKKYQVHIPANHPAGTFWYHAHKHGAVAAQVSSGMAGALIIERDDALHNLDSVPEIAAAVEEIVLLQQVPYLKPDAGQPGFIERSSDDDPQPNQATMFGPGQWPTLKRYVTVNGERIPTITMAPGEVRRLRLIDSGQRESMVLRVERAPQSPGTGPDRLKLYEIAVDGLPTGSLREIDDPGPRGRALELFPGYRSDVLIQPPVGVSGEYYLVDTRWDDNGQPRPDTGADGSPEPVRRVARIVVAGPALDMHLPQEAALRPHRLADLDVTAVTGTQLAFYGLYLPQTGNNGFFISRRDLSGSLDPVSPANAKDYNLTDPRTLTLGKTERWLVGSRNGGANVTHPFHIHTNPFLITKVTSLVEPGSLGSPVDVTAREITAPTWRDTLAMKQGYTYELLTRYDDYTGSFVNHCHILDHEDNGMMELVRIDPAAGPSAGGAAPEGNRISSTVPDGNGTPSVLFFVKGSFCPHCMTQLTQMARTLGDRGVNASVISASTREDLRAFPHVPFTLVPDPSGKLFEQYGVDGRGGRHATIVRDRFQREVLRKEGDEPFMDSAVVLAALDAPQPKFVLAVRNTDTTDDDYITWSPVACQLRLENGTPGGDPVTVTLANSRANPAAGAVRFAKEAGAGQTATAETLTLTVKQDGTPVSFFIAGSKASTLTEASLRDKGRDAVIEIHRGDAAGPVAGTRAVMVRVRKNLAAANDLERKALQAAIAKLHSKQPNGGIDVYLQLLEIHTLAPAGLFAPPFYADQAHKGPAFLAWHRAFLLRFERELQKLDPTVSLHYWRENQQPAPGQPASVFDPSGWGSNATSGGLSPVTFDAGNPLFGWEINGQSPLRAANNRGNITRFRDDASITNYATYRDDSGGAFSGDLEFDPHNEGHGWVGGWMGSCATSPRDPIFWVFHCDIDRLWALWQAQNGRYGTTGANPADYAPNDQYTPGSGDAKGHHLKDTMWPWDGVTGPGAPGDDNSNRPPSAPGGPFAKSAMPGLWPPADARPTPANVIDYAGVEDHAHDLGYCYDSIPYGKSPAPLPLAQVGTASEKAFDTTTSWAARRRALAEVDARRPAARTGLRALLRSKREDDQLRGGALRALVTGGDREALDDALAILRDPDNGGDELKLDAIHAANQTAMFTRHGSARHHEVETALEALATSGQLPVRRAALQALALTQSAAARSILTDQLRSTSPWIPPAEAIPLMQAASPKPAETADAIRVHLGDSDPAARAAAAEALSGDAASRERRLELLLEAESPAAVRRAALRGLMHADPAFPEAALRIALDGTADTELRREAVAGLVVFARDNPQAVSGDTATAWLSRLRALESAPDKSLRAVATRVIKDLEEFRGQRN